MSALDELLNHWRKRPEAGATIALCAHLAVSQRKELILEVGSAAQQRHPSDADVMLAVGRMYLAASMLPEAQIALVQASKTDATSAPLGLLGEVLLRRGDAERALKVFERATQLGVPDAALERWQDRTRIYRVLQKRIGAEAVAREVAKNEPSSSAQAPFRRSSLPSQREELQTSDFEDEDAVPSLQRAVSNSTVDEVTAPLADARASERTLQHSEPLPSFDHSGAGWSVEPPTVPGDFSYPDSIAGARLEHAAAEPARVGSEPDAPPAALVLTHLATVGLFEPRGGAKPAWEQVPKQKTRGAWVLILASVLVAGGGAAGYYYAEELDKQRLLSARALDEQVSSLLSSGSLKQLRASDEKLKQSFELNSLSQVAARLWLQNRVLHTLLAPGQTPGLDSATQRAKRVGVDDSKFAFGKVAGFLAEGDLAGAAALLPKWDTKAGKDAYYQLVAGAVLERAGDLRAIERYEAARALDNQLLVADMLLARLALLELGPEKARPVIEAFKKKGGDLASVQALEALHWAVDPERREATLAPSAKLDESAEASLPVPLRPIAYAVAALKAIQAADYEQASRSIAFGVEQSFSPAMATRLGFLAIQAGDEQLARKAALRAVSFSAVYPRARVLAARVALLGGRLEEAQKAIEQLDPISKDVAIVRAVVAYETLDGSALNAALEAFDDSEGRPELEALLATAAMLTGTRYPAAEALERLAQPHVPWGQLVAMDATISRGQLELAATLAQSWPKDVVRPVYSLRLARLARYKGESEAALRYSEQALATPTLASVTERALVLLGNEDPKAAQRLVAQYPALLGAAAGWLNILIDAASGNHEQALASASAKEFPPEAAPLSQRLLAARALWVAKDERAKDVVKLMQRVAKGHPEAALLALEPVAQVQR